MKVAITGAGGYLGSRLCAFFATQGCSVLPLTHSRIVGPAQSFSLQGNIDPDIFHGVDVLVHGAYDFSAASWNDILKTNVEGSSRLFQAALAARVKRIIFLSSMSAFSNCRSLYGEAKLLIEEEVRKVGGIVIRPGLVYDAHAGGMVGALQNAILKLPCVPVIGTGRQRLYLLHSGDLCRFVFRMASPETARSVHPVTIADEQGFSLFEILKMIAQAQRKAPLWIQIPASWIYGVLKMAEWIGIRGRLRSDGVRSLMYSDPAPSFVEMHHFGFVPRPFTVETLQESGPTAYQRSGS